ncbi:Hypothetical predicted protein [Cloeon dipterum]|uniref:Transmembrane protein n=1 Tax=Cloeon dipterum TaxID=197152 RepID=A0A8S1DNI4_9INSE|nr:Hypothetical predicted protein [Cloeon dipterum]
MDQNFTRIEFSSSFAATSKFMKNKELEDLKPEKRGSYYFCGAVVSLVLCIAVLEITLKFDLSFAKYSILSLSIPSTLLVFSFSAFIGGTAIYLCLSVALYHNFVDQQRLGPDVQQFELGFTDLDWHWHLLIVYVACTFVLGTIRRLWCFCARPY